MANSVAVGWFILRPCQHDNGYNTDDRSQIQVHTDERNQVNSAPSSPVVTHPSTITAVGVYLNFSEGAAELRDVDLD